MELRVLNGNICAVCIRQVNTKKTVHKKIAVLPLFCSAIKHNAQFTIDITLLSIYKVPLYHAIKYFYSICAVTRTLKKEIYRAKKFSHLRLLYFYLCCRYSFKKRVNSNEKVCALELCSCSCGCRQNSSVY